MMKFIDMFKNLDGEIVNILNKIKGFFIATFIFIRDSQTIYWITRHFIIFAGIFFCLSVLVNIPNIILYSTFVILMELIALFLCSIASYAYTNKKLTKSSSDIILAAIFIGVHLVVAVASTVIYSDLF